MATPQEAEITSNHGGNTTTKCAFFVPTGIDAGSSSN
jgi:hypothetical protein